MAAQAVRYRLTVDDYHRMAETNILTEDDRVELLNGELFEMAAIGSRHAACVNRLSNLIAERRSDRFIVSTQNPVRLTSYSEPQPDISVLRPRTDFYASGHPGPEDVLFLIEVADSSADYDRTTKVPLYAASNIPEVWLVDLNAQEIEVFRVPSSHGYKETKRYMAGDNIASAAFPDLTLVVDEILA